MRSALLLLALVALASALGALPQGCLGSNPELNIKVGSAVVYSTSMTLCSTNGSFFTFEGVFRNAPAPSALSLVVTYTGQAVCSTADNALIISLTPDSCHQAGLSYPPFCDSAASLYAGEFKYGVSGVTPGGVLVIDRWSGSLYPIVFTCLDNNTCDMSVACNSTNIVQLITNIYGGNVTIENSFVTTENSTNIFTGDEITLQDNNDITIEQSPSINESTVWANTLMLDWERECGWCNCTMWCYEACANPYI
jgi:hypothetical protein